MVDGDQLQKSKEQGDSSKSWLRKRFLDPLIASANPPWFDSRGIAVGLFVGMGVPIGLHMLTLGLLRLIMRYNVVVAFAFTFVNNPITIIPMYYGFYWIGSILIGKSPTMTIHGFEQMMYPILHADQFGEAIKEFFSLGLDILVRWTAGAIMVSVIVSAAAYCIGFGLLRKRCLKKAEHLGISYEKLVEKMEESVQRQKPNPDNPS